MPLVSMNDDHNCRILEALQRDGLIETDIDPVTPERHVVAVIAIARA
ncbi:hypothetical protein KTE96_02555 [Burkholderia multivorans]|nr:hypothetical protein [Burkholderia multivorans]MBU9610605.1 hypothetical protein [Burkholderia multivorans]